VSVPAVRVPARALLLVSAVVGRQQGQLLVPAQLAVPHHRLCRHLCRQTWQRLRRRQHWRVWEWRWHPAARQLPVQVLLSPPRRHRHPLRASSAVSRQHAAAAAWCLLHRHPPPIPAAAPHPHPLVSLLLLHLLVLVVLLLLHPHRQLPPLVERPARPPLAQRRPPSQPWQ